MNYFLNAINMQTSRLHLLFPSIHKLTILNKTKTARLFYDVIQKASNIQCFKLFQALLFET